MRNLRVSSGSALPEAEASASADARDISDSDLTSFACAG